jgi:hypothetical protein
MVEATTTGSSFLQPVIHRIPGNLLDSGDGRLVDTLDAESRSRSNIARRCWSR